MTTVTSHRELETMISRWEARWRFVRVMRLLPRILSGALLLGILTAIFLGWSGTVPPSALVGMVASVVIGLVVVFSAGVGLFGRQGMAAARHFDAAFGLQERLSTALELLRGDLHTTPELAAFQLADTAARAQDIDPRKELRLTVRWGEWLIALLLMIALVALLVFFAFVASRTAGGSSEETRIAVAAAQEEVRDITEDIATDSGLTDDERESLLESLEVSLEDLQAPELTSEDAFVELSELETELRTQADEIREEVAQQQAAQTTAADALDPLAETPADTRFDEQLGEAAEVLPELDEEQQEEAAQSLEEAADALEETDPETAASLREAAEALREGDTQAAQESLSAAQQSASESQQAQSQRSETAERLEEASEQAGRAAEAVAESESTANADTQSLPPDVPQAGGEEDGQGGQAETGEEARLGEGGQSTTDDEDAPSGSAPGEIDSETAEEGSGAETSEGSQESGVGSGTNEAGQRQEGGASQQSTENLGGNQTDGSGETEYEDIYAPQPPVSTAPDGSIELESAEGETTTQSGEFQDNPTGSARTPYNQVFGEYAQSASRALESENIPLGMRDVVRDYFNALAPQEP